MASSPHRRFRIALCVCAVALIVAATTVVVLIGSGALNITSAARLLDRFGGAVPAYVSSSDRDADGIDDQADILAGALAYVGTRPRYKSVYYATGYPDDGFGVCADVVAFALLGAGYDLRVLVAEDIAVAPEAYDIETPDSAIDFRRVRNLRVYLERHAQALTCDTADVDAWRGGDIVVYDGHIGIVSDRRNARGVPYLIHHASPFQLAYEEDRLVSYGPVIGHYRVGE